MKIQILTFSKAFNYGGALQALALKTKLESYGNEVVFLDYKCREIEKANSVFDLSQVWDVRYTLAHLYNLPIAVKRNQNFVNFQNEYMSFTTLPATQFDIAVVGSDQVWNYNLTGNDWTYFWDFPKGSTKKVAYAGSFGLSALEEEKAHIIKPLLQDFDFVSVREKTAQSIIKNLCKMDVPVVLDPTLLLDKTAWQEFYNPSLYEGGYIYVYTVFNSPSLWDFAYKLAAKTGKKIRTVCYSKIHRPNAECCFTAGPSEWLSHLSAADYVVTNSFHGVAFSINFNKQFFFELPPHTSGVGSRLSDITARYGLSHRELINADMDSTIDFTEVNERLNQDRSFSEQFIEQFLK